MVSSPSTGCDEICESVFAHGSSMHQKCFNHALTNMLFGLCKLMWIIDPFVIRPNPHTKVLARPFTPKVLRTKDMPQLFILLLFSP